MFLSIVKLNVLPARGIPGDDPNQRIHENYRIDVNDLSWYAPLCRIPVLAMHEPLIPDPDALILAMYAPPGVVATLASLRQRSHWPSSVARDLRVYVSSCECCRRRCWKSTSKKTGDVSRSRDLTLGPSRDGFDKTRCRVARRQRILAILVVDQPSRFSSPSPFHQNKQTV